MTSWTVPKLSLPIHQQGLISNIIDYFNVIKRNVTKWNRSSYVQVTIITVKSSSAWYVQSHCWHLKVLDVAPFRGSYVREFELSHSNLVNRIIKITHTHILHVKMLDFAQFKILYVKEGILFTRLLCSNDFNSSPPFLTSAMKLFLTAKISLHLSCRNVNYICSVQLSKNQLFFKLLKTQLRILPS